MSYVLVNNKVAGKTRSPPQIESTSVIEDQILVFKYKPY